MVLILKLKVVNTLILICLLTVIGLIPRIYILAIEAGALKAVISASTDNKNLALFARFLLLILWLGDHNFIFIDHINPAHYHNSAN